MERLCGRPGCSESASVAYGMVPTDLVFWLAPLPLDPDPDGVLCRRHADTMLVPRGWTLDDRRDPDLHLFRPPPPVPPVPAPPRRRPRRDPVDAVAEQLEFAAIEAAAPDLAADLVAPDLAAEPAAGEGDEPSPWSPTFDESDDLGGLLSAQSPLLSRAFRTADRHQR